jgi:uncharacterized repeat protein (TIGR03803 family)
MKVHITINLYLKPIAMKREINQHIYTPKLQRRCISTLAHQHIIFFIILSANLLISISSFSQCSEFYGMTSSGGDYNIGTIFSTDNNGNNLEIVYHSFISAIGVYPCGNLCKAANGKYYGMTYMGGKYNEGVLFEWDQLTNTYTKKLNFNQSEYGRYPRGSLIQCNNGKLYGMTHNGGENDKGVLFEWDPNTDTYTKKFDFDGNIKGSYPCGSLLQAKNGKLFGMTEYGGANDKGVIFEYDIEKNSYLKKIDFNGAENGKWPYGSLIEDGDGKLYGLTENGGTYENGVLFEWDPINDIYTKKIDFNDTSMGSYPFGSLMLANNEKMYGMTNSGGLYDCGVLFEWDPVTNVFTKKIDLNGTEKGSGFKGSLFQADNNKIYGMTYVGGINNDGVLFEWDPKTDTYTKKIDFNELENGFWHSGSFIQLSNGNLYGMAQSGGLGGGGVLFEYDFVLDSCIKKIDFNYAKDGQGNRGTFVQADNGKLYGLTARGGLYDKGILFEWDPKSNIFTNKHDFDGFTDYNTLVQANNGKLYGITTNDSNIHIIFEWDIFDETFTEKFDLTDSINDLGSLTLADNGKLYGMATIGGPDGDGVLFEWDTDNNTNSKNIVPFKKGRVPCSSVLKAKNGFFYGTTYGGGLNNTGILYEWNPVTKSVLEFDLQDISNGSRPIGPLVQANNGKLYGLTSDGGIPSNAGVLFEWDPVTHEYSVKLNFYGEKGKHPYYPLMKASNGKLYGSTSEGGANGYGVFFEWDPANDTYTKKFDFERNNGVNSNRLTEINKTLSAISIEACKTYTSPSGKYVWTASGIYKDTIPGTEGCDSIITVNLKINNTTTSTIQPKACQSYISPSGRYIWKQSGTYMDTIPNVNDCDSTITIELNVINIDPSIIQDRNVIISKDELAHHQWIDCDNNYLWITGETYLTYTANKSGNYAVIVSYGWCSDTSECVSLHITGLSPNPSESGITLYPNPTNGRFTIDLGKEYVGAVITITELDGRLVQKKKVESEQIIDLEMTAPAGIYVVTITTFNASNVYKIVKK